MLAGTFIKKDAEQLVIQFRSRFSHKHEQLLVLWALYNARAVVKRQTS